MIRDSRSISKKNSFLSLAQSFLIIGKRTDLRKSLSASVYKLTKKWKLANAAPALWVSPSFQTLNLFSSQMTKAPPTQRPHNCTCIRHFCLPSFPLVRVNNYPLDDRYRRVLCVCLRVPGFFAFLNFALQLLRFWRQRAKCAISFILI